jgi:ectoine hydroxylase-related dioxygenase (phytanoyl-CoA dioxygenase family)
MKLDPSSEKLGGLRESTDILGDTEAQHRCMDQDGYLYFKGLLDRDLVLEARREILLKFAIAGEIDSINHDVMDAIHQDLSFLDQVNLIAMSESIRSGTAYGNVVMGQPLLAFYEGFLEGPVCSFDFRWPRLVRPGAGTGLHADIVYIGRGTRNIWSSWIPLGDVPRIEGALVILENSHKSSKLSSYWSKDADRDNLGWLSIDPLRLQKSLGGRWLTADFEAGDVLCFSPYLVHGSLDNRSPVKRCRLSSDTRYLLAGEALDDRWNGDITNPHGGSPKAFMPGMARSKQNKEFSEEWKLVDRHGRLLHEADAQPAQSQPQSQPQSPYAMS